MKTIKGNLILEKDTIFNEDLTVEGNIIGTDGNRYNLTVKGDLDCRNLDCGNLDCLDLDCLDLDCRNLDCGNLDCGNLKCLNLDCRNLNCDNLDCLNLSFYAFAITYNSFKCKSWKARRPNYIIKCLDGEIETNKPKICDKCGSEIK